MDETRHEEKGSLASISARLSNGLLEPPPSVKVRAGQMTGKGQAVWEGSRKLAAGLPLPVTLTEIESISSITVTAVTHMIIKHRYKAAS